MATVKQKKAAKLVVENGGNISKAMVDAGYAETTAHTPQKLTDSDGWRELMGDYLKDDLVFKRHHEIILNGEDKDAVRAIDMDYKLKGYYAPEKNVNLNLDAELTKDEGGLAEVLSELFS